jgi:3-deoxy-manno-octulosonate cytidylyltransferase (CMP-KDO synthetase)
MQLAKGKREFKRVVGIIPARYASTRLSGKPLIKINGKPMIQHVYERSMRTKLIDKVIVATDDKRIFDTVVKFGGNAVMTSRRHKSGTDRIGEIAKRRNSEMAKCEIVVNIQGDEPFIDYRNIDRAIKPMLKDKSINVSTLCYKIKNSSEITNPNIVKVVFDKNNDAIYFSRYPIPYDRDGKKKTEYYKHIGLYVYRKSYLEKLIKMKPTKLEKSEKLEQLRILENGGKIKVVITNIDSHSIDTKKDLLKIRN